MAAESNRLEKLLGMLQKSPDDAFLLYGAALEYKRSNHLEEAAAYLKRALEVDPKSSYAYHQLGLVQQMLGDPESARRTLRQGVEAATAAGDGHARDNLVAALEEMS